MINYRIILLSVLVLMMFQSFSQTLPNGGFETWSMEEYYEEPETFMASSFHTKLFGDTANVTRTSDSQSGFSAAKLETMVIDGEEIPGFLMIGYPTENLIGGGIPFNERPDSLTGYYKCHMQGGDLGYIIGLFSLNGLPIGTVEGTFGGSQSDYTRFSIPVSWFIPFINPDTFKIYIATSQEVLSGHEGSVMYIDNFNFVGSSIPFPNGSFETWEMVEAEEPDDWNSVNYLTMTTDSAYMVKTTESYEGNYALKMTAITNFLVQPIGFLTNGYFRGFNWLGGYNVDQNPSKISGYYKYFPKSTDTAQLFVYTYAYDPTGDSIIYLENKLLELPAANDYQYFEVDLEYNSAPFVDTLNLGFATGRFLSSSGEMEEGSTLYLDALEIEYYPVGTNENYLHSRCFNIYPNPADDIINLKSLCEYSGSYLFEIYSSDGRKVISRQIHPAQLHHSYGMDISELFSGIYYYRVVSVAGETNGKLIIN